VLEGVGLVASGSQFTASLAAVFAEEVGGFGMTYGPIKWCYNIIGFRIHIRTLGNQQFNDFLVASD
jgi:hypothetical protein